MVESPGSFTPLAPGASIIVSFMRFIDGMAYLEG